MIDGFRQLYAEFAPTPERIASQSFTTEIQGTETASNTLSQLQAWPNPSSDGMVMVQSSEATAIGDYQLYDLQGRTIEKGTSPSHKLRIALPKAGLYILKTEAGEPLSLIRQ